MGVPPAPHALLSAYICALIRTKSLQLSRKPGFSRSDRPDIEQQLFLSLLRKTHLYDPSRGASADTFANRVVESEARMILRDRARLKRAAGFTSKSLERDSTDTEGMSRPLAGEVCDADQHRRTGAAAPDPLGEMELSEAMEQALAPLPRDVVEVAKRLMHGTAASVARELGVSRRQVYAAIEVIRGRCEEVGLDAAA